MNPVTDALRAMRGPDSATLAAQLPDIGDGLAAALSELARSPDPDRCESVAIRLNGAARHVLRVREALQREATHSGEPQ